ncbi:hypothetical protein C1H46_022174 [Malus baccata]|uniref:Uncharacterized protein n=1 Tax=Malus baccata TaxID=106549 RepID=A0A540M0D6_MALBA|nr:hypothetical protein C1H46_022174 [Malus baccata]
MMNNKGGECNLVDRISKLPEEILVTIVSLLPLKEAGATSILSKRWQYVWASTVTLDFDPKHELGEHYCRLLRVEPEQKDLLRQRYVDWVNTVVEQHRGPVIEQFRAYFDIDGHFTSSIDKWIQFAMNKRVQILELVFCNELRSNYKDVYPFPVQLLGLQNDSTLKLNPTHSDISSLHSSGYNVGFKFLRVLYFKYVDVSGKVLEYLLSNCPVLERLKVESSNNKLVNLRVVGSSMALKYLDIQFCFALRSIEIRDANLVSFMYVGGRHINLLLSNVPLLVEVCVNERIKPFLFEGRIYYRSIQLPFTQLSCCLSQLEVLMLPIDGAMYNQNDVFPILSNLKHLELRVCVNDCWVRCHLIEFIKASPYLERLVLKLDFPSTELGEDKGKAAKCSPHPNLKVVEVLGYRAHPRVGEHVMHLIKNVAALEKIIIDPVRRWVYPIGSDSNERVRGVQEVEAEVQGRAHAMQHLKENVPSTIEFVCL